jgi:hypothetical protein
LRKPPEVTAAPQRTELFSRNNRRRLDSPAAITRELGKIYRAAASGSIETAEAMRLSMILRELRTAMEAQAEAATLNLSPTSTTTNFTILCVPPGTQVDPNDPTKFIWPDGTPCSASTEFTPYAATHDWTRELPPPSDAPLEPHLPVFEEVPNNKVTVLRPHARRDDPSPGAA